MPREGDVAGAHQALEREEIFQRASVGVIGQVENKTSHAGAS
jgi:hypothetical protein